MSIDPSGDEQFVISVEVIVDDSSGGWEIFTVSVIEHPLSSVIV